ncbi:MAG: EAL domain-containing protein [Hyphomicrobiales bacterium]|nr:MAG: EAL domain-containing protein [Hyphomicrobiales bacterium]
MLTPARKTMPAIDYVSIVKSVYTDRRAMVLGALCCVLGVSTGAAKTGSLILWAIAAGFVLVAIYRYIDMTLFARANIGPTDVDAAAKWEERATYGATMFAFLCGAWCFSSFVFVQDPTAEILAMVTTVGCMVGVVTRNFGLDRLLTIQLAIAVTLIGLGVLFKNDVYHWVLGGLMLPMLISFRYLAADVRQVLLNAVHSRVEANRLAADLDTAMETMQHGLCMLDPSGLVTVANDRAEAVFLSFAGGTWTGRPFAALISAAAARGTISQASATHLLQTVNDGAGKVLLHLPGNQYCEVTVSARQGSTVLLFEDITARVKAEERINFMAHYDALTGLPNRAYFAEQVTESLKRGKPHREEDGAALMIVDVDDFKHVNDTMGHLLGDRVLVETAERIGHALGRDSLIARLGGDEFIVYRGGPLDEDDVQRDVETILAAFKAPFNVMGEVFSTNVSIGVVVSREPADDLDALMTKADLALYKAKGNGKSQSQVFRDEMDTDYRYRQRLKADLRLCVAAGGLTLVYQPIVDIRTRRVVSCEALARWHHPELGSIPPSLFIPIAEESGLISDITRWVLKSAAAECRNWPSEVSVSVNVSARDFRHADVGAMVDDVLRRSGLAASRLEIEVTETALIEEKDAATRILSNLASQGVGIALDDFGTGYSSLSYLHTLPFSKLKIDRSFVMDIASNPRALKLLQNVAQLGKDINLAVTAEGVETEEQLNLIVENTAVDQIQGYLFGVPLPNRDVGELIARMASVPALPTASRKIG